MVCAVRRVSQSGLLSHISDSSLEYVYQHAYVSSTDSAAAMAQGAGGMPEGMNPFSALANLFNGGNGGPYDGSRTGWCVCCSIVLCYCV
jgi:hypothetical protein